MLGFGLTAQKKLIPVAVQATVPVFLGSIHHIFDLAKVPRSKCNAIECAIFVFWSMRLALINTGAKAADVYAADYVLETAIKRWINALHRSADLKLSGAAKSDFYQLVKGRYDGYSKTLDRGYYRVGNNGNVDIPISETTVYLFMQRVSSDPDTGATNPAVLNALARFRDHFAVALSEGHWASAAPLQPQVRQGSA